MRVLAIDTALEACAAGLLDTDLNELVAGETLEMTRGHAEALMPLIARVMDQSGIEFADLDRLAVTVGPGSFTGLRVGIAAARGIALAAGKPAVGVSTLSAFAAPHVGGVEATIAAAIDAKHGNVYMQVFAGNGRTLVAPRMTSVREAVRAALAGPVRLVGPGATLLALQWPPDEPPPLLVEFRPAPDISWVARLGAAAEIGRTLPKPLYLRAPDARPQDAARLPRR